MSLSKKIHLREGEEIKATIYRYGLIYIWQYLLGLVLVLAPAFFMFQLWAAGNWGYAAFGVSIVVGLFFIFRAWFFSRANRLIITSERVVDIYRAGWFNEIISIVAYPEIRDIFVERKGLMPSLFNYGTLVIETKSGQTLLEAKGVYKPQACQTFIADNQENFRQAKHLANPQLVYASFVKIIPHLSDEQLEEVKTLIAAEFIEVEVDEGEEETELSS